MPKAFYVGTVSRRKPTLLMDVLGSTGSILRNLSVAQNSLGSDTRALASGLRVQSAADDPSGLAIAETLTSKINGLQQSVTNVQTAGNLLNVADAALNSVQSMLQRVRSLIVESRSDINSSGDLENIQSEISELLQEVNKISSNTSFNGLKLFNGAFDTSAATQYSVTQVASPIADTSSSRGTASDTVVNADGLGNPGKLVTLTGQGEPGPGGFVPSFMVFQVVSYSDNAVDPDSNTPVGPGVYIKFSAYSTDPSFGGSPSMVDISAVPINGGVYAAADYTAPGNSGMNLITFDLANLTQADVGTSIAFVSTAATPQGNGHSLYVNDGGDEGTAVAINLPSVSTESLGVSDISVLAPDQVNFLNQQIGASSSNQFAATSAEAAVDVALDKISQVRATVGAQMVALGDDANDAQLTGINLTDAESRIRDANIGQTTTDFTKNQILATVGQGVLGQVEVDAKLLSSLLMEAIKSS